jgi:hypothetical protein
MELSIGVRPYGSVTLPLGGAAFGWRLSSDNCRPQTVSCLGCLSLVLIGLCCFEDKNDGLGSISVEPSSTALSSGVVPISNRVSARFDLPVSKETWLVHLSLVLVWVFAELLSMQALGRHPLA